MEISFRLLNEDPDYDIMEAQNITLGKIGVSTYPKDEYKFWIEKFTEKHSIVRSVQFRVRWNGIRSDVVRQLIRATKGHPQPYVQSSRPDWTGKPRPSDPAALILAAMDFTAESFLALCNQRLCKRAMKETQETIKQTLQEMRNSEQAFFVALANCAVPNCVLFCGCPEAPRRNCGWFDLNGPKTPSLYKRQEEYNLE